MSNKIQEITQKIYREGVLKAKEDADAIIANAKTKAEEIIHSAKALQERIIIDAQKEAKEIKRKTVAEMQMAAQQFTSKLKQNITEIITTSQIERPVKNALDDVEFVQKIIHAIINNWVHDKSNDSNLLLILPEKDKKELTTFFDSKVNETLNKGVVVSFDKKLETGFKIGPYNGNFILSFTDKDFENYFKEYFKDRTKKLLFDFVEQE